MSESDFINNLRTLFVALKEGRDGYLSHSWYQEYPRECDFLVSLGVCKYTHPAVGGKRLELADAHAAALASSKPSPAFEAMRKALRPFAAMFREGADCPRDYVIAQRGTASDLTHISEGNIIDAHAALALAEKEAGK